jgi:hypothetical protein
MGQGTIETEWTDVLIRIVQDPARLQGLHALLGPYCHQGRNLLNGLKIGLYIARNRDRACGETPCERTAWDELDRMYEGLERRFDRLQMMCRPMDTALVRLPLSLLIEDRRGSWVDRFASRDRVLELIAPKPGEDERAEYDPNALGVALDAFVEWRAESATKEQGARLRWWTRGERIHLEWVESRRRRAAKSRDAPSTSTEPPSPLAFPLLIRVIAAHGGSFERIDSDGRHLRLSWPRVHQPPCTS